MVVELLFALQEQLATSLYMCVPLLVTWERRRGVIWESKETHRLTSSRVIHLYLRDAFEQLLRQPLLAQVLQVGLRCDRVLEGEDLVITAFICDVLRRVNRYIPRFFLSQRFVDRLGNLAT